MKFDNKYTDFENNETELTEKELEWFYSVVTKFHQLPEATGIVIVNRNHEELSRKNRNPHGLSWTTDYSKAEWFAHRYDTGSEEGYILKADISRSNILAYFDSRGESEVVVNVFELNKNSIEKI